MSAIQKRETGIAKGSVADMAYSQNTSIAESFLNVDVIFICDTSASMSSRDHDSQSRYERLLEALEHLQEQNPGQYAIINFSSLAFPVLGGKPQFLNGNTNMVKALELAKIADIEGITFFMISDGEPDNGPATLGIAQTFQNKIHTVFIGSESGSGREFLQKLSSLTGGDHRQIDQVRELEQTVKLMLPGN